jgi:hypothetical protein
MDVWKPSNVSKALLSMLAMAILGVAVLWVFASRDSKVRAEPAIGLSMTYALDEKSVADLTRAVSRGDCKAAERLGLFYHTVRAHGDDEQKYSAVARHWYEVANRCMRDPRLKEFLIAMIMQEGYTNDAATEVNGLFKEIEVMDPERAERMRASINKFARQHGSTSLEPVASGPNIQ